MQWDEGPFEQGLLFMVGWSRKMADYRQVISDRKGICDLIVFQERYDG
jgi:hypothetical protein